MEKRFPGNFKMEKSKKLVGYFRWKIKNWKVAG